MSRRTLTRRFREEIGTSPKEYRAVFHHRVPTSP
jgi:transcriptional regulator GlxA family with amidase domain